MAYTERLVYTQSEDGILLEGVVIAPSERAAHSRAIVWTHGITGKFYTPTVVAIGREFAERGYSFVAGNNRGHDFGAVLYTMAGKSSLGGSGWEAFDESPRDIAAWVALAAGIAPGGVVLAGHSLGALKAGYYQAQRQDERLVGLVVASAPRQAHRHSPELASLAEQMVADGRGQELLPMGASRAGAGTLSAQTLVNRVRTGLDVYGFDTPDAPVSRIRCPILAFYGTKEAMIGGPAELDVIRRNASAAPRVDTETIEGADHSYYRHEKDVAATIVRWLEGLAAE